MRRTGVLLATRRPHRATRIVAGTVPGRAGAVGCGTSEHKAAPPQQKHTQTQHASDSQWDLRTAREASMEGAVGTGVGTDDGSGIGMPVEGACATLAPPCTAKTVQELKEYDWYGEWKRLETNNGAARAALGGGVDAAPTGEDLVRLQTLIGSFASYTQMDVLENMPPTLDAYYNARLRSISPDTAVVEQTLMRAIGAPEHVLEQGPDTTPEVTASVQALALGDDEKDLVRAWDALVARKQSLSAQSINAIKTAASHVTALPPHLLKHYLQELSDGGVKVSVWETNAYLRAVSAQGITTNGYLAHLAFLRSHALPINDESLVVLMEGALMADDYSLFDRILARYAEMGYHMTGGLVRVLCTRAAQRRDLTALLDALEIARPYGFSMSISDFEVLMRGLCVSGARSAALDVVAIVLGIRDRWEALHGGLPRATRGPPGMGPLQIKALEALGPGPLLAHVPSLAGLYKWPVLTAPSEGAVSSLVGEALAAGLEPDAELLKALLAVASGVAKSVLSSVQQGARDDSTPGKPPTQPLLDLAVALCRDPDAVGLLVAAGALPPSVASASLGTAPSSSPPRAAPHAPLATKIVALLNWVG